MSQRRVVLIVAIIVAALAIVVAAVVNAESAGAEPRPSQAGACYDYNALETGQGSVERQNWFNHLDARGYARFRMACVFQWGTYEWQCLDSLVTGESHWNHTIRGRIPQAMPETKIATHGADWRTNPRVQVRWMLDYIDQRYGVPSKAGTQPPFSRRSCDAGY